MAITAGEVDIIVKALLGEFRKDLAREAEAAADKAGDQAGKTFSDKFEKQAKRLVAASLAGVFGLATKGALDLDNAARRAGASMGLLESEVGEFRGQINELSKVNPTKSFDEIANTAATVRNEMGLTGAALLAMTQRTLDWSKVTGQDGVRAARDLDQALDAYNLTAEDGARIQDALVGAQRQGAGPAAENLRILAELAPALTAANLGWESGVGLLTAFGEAGIDAETGVVALRTALAKVKSPEELSLLIEDIRTTTNDFDRASKAADLFGPRAGVRMAALLKPGSDALKGTTFDVDQFAGATEQAADTIDNSFGNRITQAFRTFLSGPLAELGSQAGPVLTGAAGLGALASAVRGLGDILTTVAATAGLKWAAILGPLAGGAALAAPAVALEQFKNPINDLLTGLVGLGDAFARVQQGFGLFGRGASDASSEAQRLGQSALAANVDLGQFGGSLEGIGGAATNAARDLRDAGDEMVEGMANLPFQVERIWPDWSNAVEFFPDKTWEQVPPTLDAALAMALALRDGIEGGRQDIVNAYGNLLKDQAGALTKMQEVAILGGVLSSGKLREGLSSENPQIAADTNALVLSIARRLDALGVSAYTSGVRAAQQFLAGFSNTSADFQEANFGTLSAARATVAAGSGAGLLEGLLADIKTAGVVVKPFTGDVNDLAKSLGLAGDAASGASGGTKKKASADKEAASAAREHEQAVKGKLTDALRTAKDAALDYFSKVHDKNLQAIRDSRDRTQREIDDARARIRAHLDEVRATAEAPVTAAEAAQRAIEDARTLRDLQERLAEAQAGGDARGIRSAEESLQSFQARRAIDALRQQADATIAAAEADARAQERDLDARQKAEDEKTALLIKAEDARYERQKANFARSFQALSDNLAAGKVKHAEIQREIDELYEAFGITMEAAGKKVGDKFAAGLIASKKAVEKNAIELAKVIETYLATHSPAKAGPLHETSPEEMGEGIGAGVGKGMLRRGKAAIEAALTEMLAPLLAPIASLTMPTFQATRAPAFAAAGAPFRSAQAAAAVPGRGGDTINVFNPAPEPAGRSVVDVLKLRSAFGD